ncbi:acetylornithine transaminase [Proteobacteria bacterium 005FR1]|nr:acetylornithine transaminase [Proteobacteria bacterium 005FR1]
MPELVPAYARGDTTFVKGNGARLWDDQGREYLDALAGVAVCVLGHAHPAVTRAICEQAETITHTSNLFNSQPQQKLARTLCKLSGMDNVFFGNSGAEANEAALKIARKYGHQIGKETPTVIVMEKSFHGRTMATLSATGNAKVREGFAPLLEGFLRVPYNDIQAVVDAGKNNRNVVGVLVEPVQGEGGVNLPAADYLSRLRALCDQNDWLLMLDEIQTGMGRTGKLFAYQHQGFLPDVVTVAKGLGNGFPIGACLARGKAAQVIQPGSHGSTFGGNPLACHTAQAVLDTLVESNLMERAAELGEHIREGLRRALAGHPLVSEVRGCGLMIGVEMKKDCGELVRRALELGLVINVTAGKVIRLLPPLILSDTEADTLIDTLTRVVGEFN